MDQGYNQPLLSQNNRVSDEQNSQGYNNDFNSRQNMDGYNRNDQSQTYQGDDDDNYYQNGSQNYEENYSQGSGQIEMQGYTPGENDDMDPKAAKKEWAKLGKNTKDIINNEGILAEPVTRRKKQSNLIHIKNLKTEKDEFRKMGIIQKPKAIHLHYCRQYAEQHLKKQVETISDYQFKLSDVRDGFFSRDIINRIKKLGTNKDPESLSDEEFSQLFETETKKLFYDFMIFGGTAYLIIKSWQKVSFKLAEEQEEKKRKSKNTQKRETGGGNQKSNIDKNIINSATLQNQDKNSQIKNIFYIKTLEVRNKYGQPLNDKGPILIEQVFGNFDQIRLYDTSYCQFQDKLYYFKRQFTDENDVNLDEADDGEGDPANIKFVQNQDSILKMYEFNFTKMDEKEFDHIYFNEYSDDIKLAHEKYKKTNKNRADAQIKPQFNITFSKEFGQQNDCHAQATVDGDDQKQQDFLISQHFTIQQYTMSQEFHPIKIMMISDQKKVGWMYEIYGTSQGDDDDYSGANDGQHIEDDINRQIQFMNHIILKSDREERSVVYIITNMYLQVQVTIDFGVTESGEERISYGGIQEYHRKQTDIFQRIWNSGGIFPQKESIEFMKNNSKQNKDKNVEQYFFVDSRNKIQLLYPNYKSNIDILRAIENISEQSQIYQKDSNLYKKIICLMINQDANKNKMNGQNELAKAIEAGSKFSFTLREIESLKGCLNDDKVHCAQSFTFIKDSESQILYITEPKSDQIWRYDLQNSFTICCGQDEKNKALMMNGFKKNLKKDISNMTNSQINDPDQLKQQMELKSLRTMRNLPQNNEVENQQQVMEGQRTLYLGKIREDHHANFFNNYKNDNGEAKLSDEEALNFIFIDGLQDEERGKKSKIRTFEIIKDQIVPQMTKLVWFQWSKNQVFALFIFRVYNEKRSEEEQNNQSYDQISEKSVRRNYFFVRKSRDEMRDIIQNQKSGRVLIKNDDDVLLMKSYHSFVSMKLCDIKEFQFDMNGHAKDTCNIVKGSEKTCSYRDVSIALPPKELLDSQEHVDFFVFIYQEKSNNDNNKLIVFDISEFIQPEHYSINASPQSCDFLFEDEDGYNTFLITRTSDIDYNETPQMNHIHKNIQKARYQIFTLYSEKVGRIQGEEFLVQKDDHGARAHTIGQKQILLSKRIIQECEWSNIKDSQVSPYKDAQGSIRGCKFILQQKPKQKTTIEMIDQKESNLYTYKTSVLLTGKKQFNFHPESEKDKADLNAVVVSSLLRKEIIEQCLFERSEAYTVLKMAQEIILQMRIPDLEQLVLQSFSASLKNEFFQAQEVLQGKSLGDICLSDSELIKEAIKNFKHDHNTFHSSLIEKVIEGDKLRKDTFVLTDFYPKQLIIQVDLNFVSTIERAIVYISFKSLKLLLDEIIQVLSSADYQPLLMYDLPNILESKQVEINDFFELSKSEVNMGACKLEIEFESAELPPFSNHEQEHQKIQGFQNFLNIRDEITEYIIYKDSRKDPGVYKQFEIEYFYVDFQMQIIGEKIRGFTDEDQKDKRQRKFDDLYYAQLIAKKAEDEINNKFFQRKSIQKIIDSQWVQTKRIQVSIFAIYFLMYIIPMCICSFKISDEINNLMFKIALFPALILLIIESIQIKQQGIDYFIGWNLVDFLQLLVFGILFFLRFEGLDNSLLYFAQLKLLNIILAFFKLLFFVRIFEAYGFLVQMVVYCVQDLIPFLISYVTFLIVFSICYVVLQLDIDAEVSGAAKILSYFQQCLLETFRNAIGELALPAYDRILEQNTEGGTQPTNIFVYINIYLIWFVFFIQTYFLQIIMLNFMIAVIMTTYERVTNGNLQVVIGYKHKADLNHETFMLTAVFTKLKKYRCFVFSSAKDEKRDGDSEYIEQFNNLIRAVNRQHQEIKSINKRIEDKFEQIFKFQDCIEKTVMERNIKLQKQQDDVRNDLVKVLRENNPIQNSQKKN